MGHKETTRGQESQNRESEADGDMDSANGNSGWVDDPGTGRRSAGAGARAAPFEIDIAAIEQRARQDWEDGTLTRAYTADPVQVVEVLNAALATEIVCALRYRSHYYTASGVHGKTVADEFLEHANQEQKHTDWLAKRISQLHGTPNFNPDGLAQRSHAKFHEGGSLVEMIREDLVSERIAIETYSELIRWLGDRDVTSRRIIEDILAEEEEHAEDLLQLLARVGV